MSRPASRRGFLRGLVSLPLVGGSVALIGAPSAVALPCTLPALEAYTDWLAREYGGALIELAPLAHPDREVLPQFYDVARHHAREWCGDNLTLTRSRRISFEHPPAAPPSARAALVMSAVGHDWREGGR